MPQKVDECVQALRAKWREDPSSKPERYKKDGEWVPVETEADEESAAWAICNASVEAAKENTELLLASMPVLAGAAAVNDPHITRMEKLRVEVIDGKEYIVGQVLRVGQFLHSKAPKGILNITRDLLARLINNFENNVIGRDIFLDKAHKPNEGALGTIVELFMNQAQDGLMIKVDPTSSGLELIKDGVFNYLSVWMYLNWKGTDVGLSAAEMEEVDIVYELDQEEVDMAGEDKERVEGGEDLDQDQDPQEDQVQLTKEEHDEYLRLKARAEQDDGDGAEIQALRDRLADQEERLKLQQERLETQERHAEAQLELARLGQVDNFVKSLSIPNEEGFALDGGMIEVIECALRRDPIGEGEYTIELEADRGLDGVYDYFDGVIKEIALKAPRTVPAGTTGVEAADRETAKKAPDVVAIYDHYYEMSRRGTTSKDQAKDKAIRATKNRLLRDGHDAVKLMREAGLTEVKDA